MTGSSLPPWPAVPPAHGRVQLHSVDATDVAMARELSTDPYVPLTGSLPADATEADALAWISRQRERHRRGTGFSFSVREVSSGASVGHCGLWFSAPDAPLARGGFAIVPSARGRGLAADALCALASFGWTLPQLARIELAIEPGNTPSIRTAHRAGFRAEPERSTHTIGGEAREVVIWVRTRPTDGRDRP